jgi:hypothetical protein
LEQLGPDRVVAGVDGSRRDGGSSRFVPRRTYGDARVRPPVARNVIACARTSGGRIRHRGSRVAWSIRATCAVDGEGGDQPRKPRQRLPGYDGRVSKANGNLLVTVRTRDVEQVFCTAENAAAITFADLTKPNPEFIEIALDAVRDLNSDVARMIR